MKISFIFAWYDLWVGFFYDKKKNWLYILPIPMVGIILKFKQKPPCPKCHSDSRNCNNSAKFICKEDWLK